MGRPSITAIYFFLPPLRAFFVYGMTVLLSETNA